MIGGNPGTTQRYIRNWNGHGSPENDSALSDPRRQSQHLQWRFEVKLKQSLERIVIAMHDYDSGVNGDADALHLPVESVTLLIVGYALLRISR